jgi:hypothetical protein
MITPSGVWRPSTIVQVNSLNQAYTVASRRLEARDRWRQNRTTG